MPPEVQNTLSNIGTTCLSHCSLGVNYVLTQGGVHWENMQIIQLVVYVLRIGTGGILCKYALPENCSTYVYIDMFEAKFHIIPS